LTVSLIWLDGLALHGRIATLMATSIRLRPWQRDALEAYRSHGRPDFLAVATPGAGKTTFALTAAAQALAARDATGVVVVAPTQHLKLQWSQAAARLGMHLDPNWSARDGVLPADMHGIVTTYQQVATSSGPLRSVSSGAFVVLDEIHHAGDDRAWGESVLAAFELASRRLSLSGTPFRSDTSSIPFVDYHFDEARADYEYGYGEALTDGGVVRPVFFPRIGGHMEWTSADGSDQAASFDDDLTSDLANQRLRTALSLEGEWLPSVLADANAQLMTMRRKHPEAGGLVIAMDQAHALGIAELIRRRHRVDVVVATSDDPMASEKIARFAHSNDPWIVAVRMVSEGVDIPRLRLGVFATNTTTELFFRQAVGRLVRWTSGLRSQKAFLYIPDDPRLRRSADGIVEQRRHSRAKREEDGFDDPSALDDRDAMAGADDDGQMSLFAVISAVAGERSDAADNVVDDGVFTADDQVWDVGVHAEPEGFDIDLDIPPPRGGVRSDTTGGVAGETLSQRKSRLRRANAEAAKELVRNTRLDHRAVNAELNRLSGIRRVTEATSDELQLRLDAANKWLRRLR